MNNKLDWKGTELVEGGRVKIIREDTEYGNPDTDYLRKQSIYGIVQSAGDRNKYWCPERATLLDFPKVGEMRQVTKRYVLSSCLEVIPKEEYEAYESLIQKATKDLEQKMEYVKSIIDLPNPKVNFSKRTFDFNSKDYINTNTNVVELGRWDRNDGRNTFHHMDLVYYGACCSFTKTDKDLQVFIPKIWMRYYEYLTYDLVEWLKFLSKCGIGFDYEFLGDVDLSQTFEEQLPKNEGNDVFTNKLGEKFTCNYTFGELSSYIQPFHKSGYCAVRLKASDVNVHLTYFRFLCLRYIYNHQYWTIPGHAMQIKQALGEEVTHWQALLMAHLYMPYYFYYSFGHQTDVSSFVPYSKEKAKENPFSHHDNYDRHIYPFQDVNVFLERLASKVGPNLSIEYICDAYSRKELSAFFQKKDYIGLYSYLQSKEEQKDEKQWRILQPIKAKK